MRLQIAIASLILISSCHKQVDELATEKTTEREAKVEDGHLVFRTFPEFSNFFHKVNSISSQERLKIEEELGFKSLATTFENLKRKIGLCDQMGEINNLLKDQQEEFAYGDNGLFYKKDNDIFAGVIDKSGLIKVGDVLYKSIDQGRIIATTSNYSLLKSINSIDDFIEKGTDEIKIDWFLTKQHFIDYRNLSTAGPYSSGTNKHYLLSVRNESNNRRLYVEMIHQLSYFPQYSGTFYNGFTFDQIKTLSFSHTKKGAFGIWSAYTSPTYISEISFQDQISSPGTWISVFSGTLSNNSSNQSYNGPGWGTPYPTQYIGSQSAPTWVEPVFRTPTRIVCTGNGQNWYTNIY